ncbi:MAG: AraC family transcriptional regulator [Clostridia bacterium]|nr:AraC family transcriptional regulator [Clostridia bacterium]
MIRNACGSAANEQGRELTQHGTAAFPLACYNDDLQAERVPWHWHDEWEASIVVEGEVAVHAGAQSRRFRVGDGFFINSRVLHTVERINDGPCRIYTIVFHPRFIGGDSDSAFWQNYVQPLLAEPMQELFPVEAGEGWKDESIACFRNAWKHCAEKKAGFEIELRYSLSRLAFLLGNHRAPSGHSATGRESREGARIKAMLLFIHENYAGEIDTAAIAASASVSASECLRCFHNTIHMTPIQYLRQYRIQRAAELLRLTDMKIADVGAHCGFQEMSYFARTFRELRGCTPREYREGAGERQGICP